MINKIHHGDCLDLMKNIKDGSIELILTDIPYGEVNRKSYGLRNLDKGVADEETFKIDEIINECVRICNGSIYIFCGTEQVSMICANLVSFGMSTRLCIWEKTNPSPMNGKHIWLSGIECFVYGKKRNATFNEHCKNTVFKLPTVRGKLHPTMKPIKLFERLILASSNEGDIVLDFCMSSGTTAIAAINTNRNFIGIEKEKKYVDIANKRIYEN